MASNAPFMSYRPKGTADFAELYEVNPQEDSGLELAGRVGEEFPCNMEFACSEAQTVL